MKKKIGQEFILAFLNKKFYNNYSPLLIHD